MIELKVFWLQPATNASLQTADTQTPAPRLHARRFPYRANSVDFGVGGKSHDTDVIVGATCATPVCLFDFGPGGATRRGVDAAIDAAPTFDNAMIREINYFLGWRH